MKRAALGVLLVTLGACAEQAVDLSAPSAADVPAPDADLVDAASDDADRPDRFVDADPLDIGTEDLGFVDLGRPDGGFIDAGQEPPNCEGDPEPIVDVRNDEALAIDPISDAIVHRGMAIVLATRGLGPTLYVYDSHPGVPHRRVIRLPVDAVPGSVPQMVATAAQTLDVAIGAFRDGFVRSDVLRNVLAAPTLTATATTGEPLLRAAATYDDQAVLFAASEERFELRVGARRYEGRHDGLLRQAQLLPHADLIAFWASTGIRIVPFDFTRVAPSGPEWTLLNCPSLNGFHLAAADNTVYVSRACGGTVRLTRHDRTSGNIVGDRSLSSASSIFVRAEIGIDAAGQLVVARWPFPSGVVLHLLDPNLADVRSPVTLPDPDILSYGAVRLGVSPDRPGEAVIANFEVIRITSRMNVARVRLCR